MDRLDRLEQVVKSLNEAMKELQAEVKALKGEIAKRPISWEQRLLEWAKDHD
jgi:chaperonin cofactor prefoldin